MVPGHQETRSLCKDVRNLIQTIITRGRRTERKYGGKVPAGGGQGREGGGTVTFGDEPYVRGLKDMTELFLVQYYSDI